QRIGSLLWEAGDGASAEAALHRAMQVSDRFINPASASRDLALRRANLDLSFGRVHQGGDLARALVYTKRSLTAFSGLAKRFPDDDEILFSLWLADPQAGFELSSLADPEAAVSHYERMVALREALVRRHPNDFVYRRALMLGYEHLAAIHGSALSPNL